MNGIIKWYLVGGTVVSQRHGGIGSIRARYIDALKTASWIAGVGTHGAIHGEKRKHKYNDRRELHSVEDLSKIYSNNSQGGSGLIAAGKTCPFLQSMLLLRSCSLIGGMALPCVKL